jgi:hypothetical protein
LYKVQYWMVLPFGGTAGLMDAVSLDCDPAFLDAANNPDPWNPTIAGAAVYFSWPAASVSLLYAEGEIYVSEAVAANPDPAVGLVRAHANNANGGVITAFDTVVADCSIRVRRTGPSR